VFNRIQRKVIEIPSVTRCAQRSSGDTLHLAFKKSGRSQRYVRFSNVLLAFVASLSLPASAFSQESAPLAARPQEIISTQTAVTTQVPSRVIVRFRDKASFLPDTANYHALGAPGLFVADLPPGLSVTETVHRYQANPNVDYAEPDFIVKLLDTTPNDPLWSQQWDMAKISAPAAWSTNTSAADVIVAVIDTGVDATHPDLKANLWINPVDGTHGFTCMNGSCVNGGIDDFGHGTHVAGTIGAAGNNGVGMAGLNWHTQILSCKFMGSTGSGNVSDAVLCFNQLLTLKQQGFNIRVTNNSWGSGGFSQALQDAMTALEAVGVVNVCAAGNSGVNTDIAPMYPGAYNNRALVSVIATDANDNGASFTNYGIASTDIAAPGVSTLSTVPTGTCTLCSSTGYLSASGTSMAAPHVTGVLAAMLELYPGLTAIQARDAILNPASYDVVTDTLGSMSSTGGRLNMLKAITNPFLSNPKINNFPTVSGVSNVTASAGTPINMVASASDPDGDPIRMMWARGPFNAVPGSTSLWLLGYMLNSIFPTTAGGSVSFTAPSVGTTAMATYSVGAADGRGGAASAVGYTTIQPSAGANQPPSGTLSVSPTTGPVGTTLAINFPLSDPLHGATAWDVWQTGLGGGFGWCCQTGTSFNLPINQAGAFRITAQAISSSLNFSNRQSTVVRIGGAAGTPPIANAVFNTLTGPAPLTVNIDMSGSTDPDGTIQQYLIECQHGSGGTYNYGPTNSCVYDTPGNYWIMLQVKDNDGLMDTLSVYAVVTPASSGGGSNPPAPKTVATVTLSNLTQTYTGGTLTPTAATNPSGLSIVWINAPQSAPGTYSVTATVNDPNYQGSASGSFTINKAPATVTLANLTQAYTGAALTPSATTSPKGLSVSWTNAPQTAVGTYTVMATINDANYQGSASGTFTITKPAATVTLSNLTQTYTGSPLTPTATTNPAGLSITWTNATQTAAGTYTVTATVNDPNYTGSATGTFVINKASATVSLGNLSQGYTGSALKPTATTSPSGLAVTWTNAPQTAAGTYTVTATVNDSNYQGSATGTFTITSSASSVAPSVTITSPAAGTLSTTQVTIQAAVTPGTNPIAHVDFLINGTVKCSDTAAPYACSWNVPGAKGKTYQLQTKAYDTVGLVGSSAVVTVNH
jgi:subtilisin family serine protease/uncharacterized protein with FMN-binding domain